MIKQTPIVVDKLQELGMIELWKTFYTMLSNGTFPVDNIAFLLFLDVLKWYGKSKTLAMRYDETVCKFWRLQTISWKIPTFYEWTKEQRTKVN